MTNNTLTNRQAIEQRRAASAWDQIRQIEETSDQDSKLKNKYGTLARGFAAMIQVNGLAAAVAFLLAKASRNVDEHKLLYNHLQAWLKKQLRYQKSDLMEFIGKEATTEDYRRATAEAIAYAIWLKRYVEAKDWKSSEE